MSDFLLLMSIGPVQEFIATARQCQDLWYGSHLLSILSEAAARSLASFSDTLEHTLVFPAGLDAGTDAETDLNAPKSVANKILAVLHQVDEAQIRQVVRHCETSIHQSLKHEVDQAFKRLRNKPGFMYEVACQQVAYQELIEFSWVAEPLPHDSAYPETRAQAEASLAAVKASKQWKAPSWETQAGVPKSSLDGVRESVIHDDEYNRDSAELRRLYRVKKGERLCGVGMLKRWGMELDKHQSHRPAFHSTSHLAAGPSLAAIARLQPTDALETLADELEAIGAFDLDDESRQFYIRAGTKTQAHLEPPAWIKKAQLVDLDHLAVPRVVNFDGQASQQGWDAYLMYPNRVKDILERVGQSDSLATQSLTRAQHALLKSIGHSEMHAYYAVLLADGDRMGAALDAIASLASQKNLGSHLNQFADQCLELVESLGGSLIYSGGDDVLALMPVHTALECADRLRLEFDRYMQLFEQKEANLSQHYRRPTLSVGMAIVHHLEPMSDALSLARQAEKKAKLAGRNALSLVAVPRGGSPYWAAGQWALSEQNQKQQILPLYQRITQWAQWLYFGALPRGISHELIAASELFEPKTGKSETAIDGLEGAFFAYVKGIIQRKRSKDGQEKAGDEPILAIQNLITAQPSLSRQSAVKAIGEEIEIARFFLKASSLAWLSESPSSQEQNR